MPKTRSLVYGATAILIICLAALLLPTIHFARVFTGSTAVTVGTDKQTNVGNAGEAAAPKLGVNIASDLSPDYWNLVNEVPCYYSDNHITQEAIVRLYESVWTNSNGDHVWAVEHDSHIRGCQELTSYSIAGVRWMKATGLNLYEWDVNTPNRNVFVLNCGPMGTINTLKNKSVAWGVGTPLYPVSGSFNPCPSKIISYMLPQTSSEVWSDNKLVDYPNVVPLSGVVLFYVPNNQHVEWICKWSWGTATPPIF
jgi:hypothetical protein